MFKLSRYNAFEDSISCSKGRMNAKGTDITADRLDRDCKSDLIRGYFQCVVNYAIFILIYDR